MSWQDIIANDFGWTGKLTIEQDGTAVDISIYTTLQFIFQSPSGTVSIKTASFDTDGTDGVLAYTIADGDIDEAGTWRVYARVKKSGVELTSQYLNFIVDADPS